VPASARPAARVRIPTPANFVFHSTVVSHGWYLLAPFRWSPREGILRRAEVVGRRTCDLEIRAERGTLTVAGAPDGPSLRSKICRMFQLEVDTSEFLAAARSSPAHSWVEASGFGRLLCGSTLFEDAVKIITTTNTTWQQTVRMVDLLVAKCGRVSPLGQRAFPAPREIVRFSEDELQRDCRLGYRAKTIRALASGVIDGSIDLELLANPAQTTEELFASYRSLPGIGPYGAAHLLAMDGRHDFIAVDSEFRRFVRETYHKGRRVSDAAMLRRYARWGRWKYLAYWSELWRSVAERLQPAEPS
jgi:3-methyladenine DNA glycosylase/8-oxoguanine DNA glycosylase